MWVPMNIGSTNTETYTGSFWDWFRVPKDLDTQAFTLLVVFDIHVESSKLQPEQHSGSLPNILPTRGDLPGEVDDAAAL